MFERRSTLRDYEEEEPFDRGGADGAGAAAAALHAADIRAPGRVRRPDARVLGRLRADERLAELARGADLFVCEATLERGDLDGEPRGHLSADEAREAFEASGAKRLLLTHRPYELPLDDGLEQAYDGLVIDR